MALVLRFAHYNVMTVKRHPETYTLEDLYGRTYTVGYGEMAQVAVDFGWDPREDSGMEFPMLANGDIDWENDEFQAAGARYLHSLLDKNIWVHDEERYFEQMYPQQENPMAWRGGDPAEVDED